MIGPPKFFRAILDRADFRDVQYYSLARNSSFTAGYLQKYSSYPAGEFALIEGYPEPSLWAPTGDSADRSISEEKPVKRQDAARVFQRNLRAAFHSSNWKSALLSPEAAALLEQSKTLEPDYVSVFVSPQFSGDPDSMCTPRRT
jgi:hypothetical protein